MRSLVVVMIVAISTMLGASRANGQFLETFEEKLWGVQVSFTPEWTALKQFRSLIQADDVSLAGSEYSVGFARGRMSGGHWGLSLVRERVKKGAVCFPQEPPCYEPTGSTRLQGLAFNWFLPFGSRFAGDRIQVGMNVDVGAGWYDGMLRAGDVEIAAGELLRLQGPDGPGAPIPIMRVEFAAGVTVAPGLKVIGSGGYGLPGSRRVTLSIAYFPLAGR